MEAGVREEAAEALGAGAAELGLRLPPSGEERLLAFLDELRRWNRAYNLVADAPPLAWVRAHLLDSLAIGPRLRAFAEGADRSGSTPAGGTSGEPPASDTPAGRRPDGGRPGGETPAAGEPPAAGETSAGGGPYRVLDVGSGAGLPGIPLAIALPELRFVLLDANGKKARFCRHAVAALGLPNVEVVEERVERYAPPVPFDAAVVRAVGSLARVRALVRPCCRGPILAMKGRYPARELAALGEVPFEAERLRVPGLQAERHLVVLR